MKPECAVFAMFANQAEWLACNVSNPARFTGTLPQLQPDDLVLAGSQGVVIAAPDAASIDEGLSWLRTTESTDILAWSAEANAEADILLLTRGCRDSFRPRWMRRNLAEPLPVPRLPPDIELLPATPRHRESLLAAGNVPYVSRNQIPRILDLATAETRPRHTWLLLARRKRRGSAAKIVGAGILHLSDVDGECVGGLYNLGVDPAWQRQGIGTALTAELCRIARDEGATSLLLNATPAGERIYRALDFAVIGDGQTWFLPSTIFRDPPTATLRKGAEALARGEYQRLDPVIARRKSLPNGESPIRFAARYRQAATIRWLLDNGAIPDIAALWSAGFREEAIMAMTDVRFLNIQLGPESTAPMHEAVRNGDTELVQALIAAGADLTLRDAQWHGRPLDWANALGHPDLAARIEGAM
jgi:ribosomal protein S18 acetylase RimI-like enzyme